jgi:DnaA-homolog protein
MCDVEQLLLDIITPPKPTLTNYVTGRNREALAALQNLIAPTGATPKVIYLWGETFSGKTHLLQALEAESAPFTLLHTPLANALQESSPEGASLRHYGLDNVDSLNSIDQAVLFDLINAMNAPMLQQTLVVTGRVSPRDLLLRRDLATRLASDLVFWLQPLSDEDKHQALIAYGASNSFTLRDDVAGYLLRHGRRDMASLFNMIDRLAHYASQVNKPITLALLRELNAQDAPSP